MQGEGKEVALFLPSHMVLRPSGLAREGLLTINIRVGDMQLSLDEGLNLAYHIACTILHSKKMGEIKFK